ncbi:hypothetical protein [Mesorhizobium sp.]|uniref:hypothetical protein n=1 Tax=Mesorhizobium sp. TaxID=1871066 RepID=UPI000FE9E5FA|nr:hypothetical protein [Mesorhizobium sp.]RWK11868.1 MAG: hypothetical protein EOR39_07055 [Mesorhizobium sp.]TIQ49037.1 MAG: hypothetical protein E5X47_14515 [Mesorhizobium sp.]TIQ58884.1 MAG: hypothetical protein E5X46_09890 [Mesorhizobium sp.]
MRQHNATFANFICRFGDDKVLLDYAYEIVIPAFTRDTYVRSYGTRTHYHFYEVEIVTLDHKSNPPTIALAGRFVKDTELTRYQVFDELLGLIQDERKMRSAPSSFFILVLNNHRMIYFPETPHAPDLKSFEATAAYFLQKRHQEYISELYDQARRDGQRKATKKALVQAHPWPTLQVVPLTGADSIEEFVRRYETLKQIDFRLVRPNDDIDAGEIFSQIRDLSQSLNADRTKITTANPDEGLDITAAIETITEATAGGNQEVTLNGVDLEGNNLSGNNESFQINAPIADVPPAKEDLIKTLYEAFQALIASETLKVPQQGAEQAARMQSLIDRLD